MASLLATLRDELGADLEHDADKIVKAVDLGHAIPWGSIVSSVKEAVTNQKAAIADGSDEKIIITAADILKIIGLAVPPVAVAADYAGVAADLFPVIAPGLSLLLGGGLTFSLGSLSDNAGEQQSAIVEDRFQR